MRWQHIVGNIALALALLTLLALGTWQVMRKFEKQQEIAQRESYLDQLPFNLEVGSPSQLNEYQPVAIDGRLRGQPLRWYGHIRDGQPMVALVQQVELGDHRRVWVSFGVLPESNWSEVAQRFRSGRAVIIDGIIRTPPQVWLKPRNEPDTNVWFRLDLDAMSAATKQRHDFSFYISATSEAFDDQEWPQPTAIRVELPDNHLGYALTWYGLALALVMMIVIRSKKYHGPLSINTRPR